MRSTKKLVTLPTTRPTWGGNIASRDIFTNLALCRDYEVKEDHEDEVSDTDSQPFYSNLDATITHIRARLSQHLVGVMSDEIRKLNVKIFYGALREVRNEVLWKKFRKNYWQSFYESSAFDVCDFLDCVLDDHFEELEIDAVLPYLDPDPKLITTIAQRSGYLEKLKLDFSLMNEKFSTRWKTDEKLNQLILGLSSLQNLTTLSLDGLSGGVHKTLYKAVAKSCPLLSHLSIDSCKYVEKVDVLSLILVGEIVDKMFKGNYNGQTKWSADETLQRLQVPPEFLTPMCSTLQCLYLGYYFFDDSHQLDSTFAFALRHLPKLQNLDVRDSTVSTAVKIFHETSGMEEPSIYQAEFGEFFGLEKKNSSPLPSAPKTLALTTLKCVDVTDKDLLRIIGTSFPFLKDVTFDGETFKRRKEFWMKSKHQIDEYLNDSLDGLESILSSWPKLESATMKHIYSSKQHFEVLLKVFGPELLHLTLDYCSEEDVNLEHLQPCSNLESLRFRGYLPNTSIISKAEEFQWKEFLPQLKSIESDVCLGSTWSRIFEEKPTLTSVILNCCHIGTEASGQADWSSIPKMWPHLEILHIPQSKGLTMAIVEDLVSELSSLKAIRLPQKMKCMSEGMKRCYEPPSSLNHFDNNRFHTCECHFLPVEEVPNNNPRSIEEDDECRADYYDDDNGDRSIPDDDDEPYEDPGHYYDYDRLSYGSDPGAWEL